VEAGAVGARVAVNGVEIAYWRRGEGIPVLCIHETASAAAVWRPLAAVPEEGLCAIAYDRRGWGASTAPDPYLRTTIEEQAEDAAALLERLGSGPAILCGAGLGAVVALDLILRRPALVRGALLIEPPLLALLPEATEGISADAARIESAVAAEGPAAAIDLFLRGELSSLGAGAERLPPEIGAVARRSPLSLFAELGAVPGWSMSSAELAAAARPTRVAVSSSTPPLLRRAAEELAGRLGGSALVEVGGSGLPHLGAATELVPTLAGLGRA
jgi:pimeloyl-ACP methyl ester carboxylesterase